MGCSFSYIACLPCSAKKRFYNLLASPHELKTSFPTTPLLMLPILMMKSFTLGRATIVSSLVEDPWISNNLFYI